MIAIGVFFAVAGTVAILVAMWRAHCVAVATEAIQRYEERYPGRCGECAIHAYAIDHGFEPPGSVPGDHRCCERFERWRGAMHTRKKA